MRVSSPLQSSLYSSFSLTTKRTGMGCLFSAIAGYPFAEDFLQISPYLGFAVIMLAPGMAEVMGDGSQALGGLRSLIWATRPLVHSATCPLLTAHWPTGPLAHWPAMARWV